MGPGKAELLEHIASTGSISQAAKLMEMSYNRAWLHVKVMNENFREPLVNSSRGGTEGGGASLTETGRLVLELYRQMELEAATATAKTEKKLTGLFKR
jgi:molybdate transport system regulatory protein